MTQQRVLIVDDEPSIRELLSTALHFAGYDCATAADGEQMLARLARDTPDLILLDIMMPGMDGLSAARRAHERGLDTPIIFVTAKDRVSDKVAGLAVGDDYITKPFSMDEVIARVGAVLRRGHLYEAAPQLSVAGLVRNDDQRTISAAGRQLDLSPTEYELLSYLMENAGRTVSKQQIMDAVWPPGFVGDSGIVESYVSYLRRKLTPVPGAQVIRTRRGYGYMLDPVAAAQPVDDGVQAHETGR